MLLVDWKDMILGIALNKGRAATNHRPPRKLPLFGLGQRWACLAL